MPDKFGLCTFFIWLHCLRIGVKSFSLWEEGEAKTFWYLKELRVIEYELFAQDNSVEAMPEPEIKCSAALSYCLEFLSFPMESTGHLVVMKAT